MPEPENAGQPENIQKTNWTIPNTLTLARIALILPFLYFIKTGRFWNSLIVFFIASCTDFIDGYIARRFSQQSSLGRFLDPLADKILVSAGFIVLSLPHPNFPSLPLWITFLVIGRDVLILVGSLVVYLATRYTGFKPTFAGRVNTFVEMGLIVVFLVFHAGGFWIWLLPVCYFIVAASVLVSGSQYLFQGFAILRRAKREALGARH